MVTRSEAILHLLHGSGPGLVSVAAPGVDFQGLAQGVNGVLEVPRVHEATPQIEPRVTVLRVQFHHLVEAVGGLGDLA